LSDGASAVRVRVLMLNERDLSHPLAGGVEVHLEEIASRLVARHGIEMTVLCAAFPGAAAEEVRQGIRYVRFGDRSFSYYAQIPGRARAELATGGCGLVVENLCKLLFFSRFYLPGVPRLALVHHLFGASAFRQVAAPIASYVVATEALLPLLYRGVPFVAVSPSTRDDLIKRGIPRRDIRVIPNGLDHVKYRPADAPAASDLVVFVGRLEHYKGVDLLLEAWLRVRAARPAARLVIVGSGTAGEEMRRRAQDAGFGGSVSFAGFVSEADKIAWLQRATVLVQPSRKEGWGLTVLEANACGAPVVATDVPGLRDSVRHGSSGLLAAPNATSLAASLVAVLGDAPLRARLAREARAWSERFSWDHVSDAFADVVHATAAGRPLPEVPDFLGATLGAAPAETRGSGAHGDDRLRDQLRVGG
jgi:glycosyltransferase involved in cell wall biosynthesis